MMTMSRRLSPKKHPLQLLMGDEVHIPIIRRLFRNEWKAEMERSRLAKIRTGHTHYGAAVAVFFVTLASAVVCNAATPTISQEDLLKKIESGEAPLILDVRTPGEYRSGHVPHAINIPHNELASRLVEFAGAKDREVVTYREQGRGPGSQNLYCRKRVFRPFVTCWETCTRGVAAAFPLSVPSANAIAG